MVDLVGGSIAARDERQVDDRYIDRRHADRVAVEAAVQLGQYEADRRGGAGLGRNHVMRGRPSATKILVEHIGQHLVVGVRVHRRHQSVDDADVVVQHLGDGRQAVGGARCIGDHGVRCLQCSVIDAVDDGGVDVLLARRRDDHFLRAAGQVEAGLGLAGEETGAFEDDIDAVLRPWNLRRIADGQHRDAVAIDHQMAAVDLDVLAERSVRGVMTRQIRIGLRIAQVIQRDDLDVGATRLVQRAQDVAADATISVDADLDCHDVSFECAGSWRKTRREPCAR